MRLLYILISFGLLISSSFSYSQDYSKSVTRFRFNSKFDSIQKEHVFTYKLPTDGYSFQISLDSKVVPIAMFVKYSDLEVWTGFVGQRSNDAYKQEELSLEEKKRLLKIQSPSTRSLIESQIESSLPDPKKISGGIEGGKYLVKDKNGTDLVTFKKVGADLFNFRSKLNVPLLGNQPSENPIFFKEDYIKDIYKELNIDPSKQSLIITEGRERDHIDNGTCVLVDKPAEFYLDYFSEMNFQNRNFIGELIFYKENCGLIENINSAIRGVGGKEIISIFQNGDDNAVKATEKIVGGSVFFTDGSSYGEILSSENSFTFNKKGKLDGITIIVFTPLEESSFVINLKQIPEGLNQIFYKSGQLEEEYNIQYGKLNGEKITYYEDKNYKIGQDTKPIKEITTYLNGSKTGVRKEYDLNQNLVLEEDLKDGIKNGKYKKCVNGKVIEEGNYVNNGKEGEWTTLNSSEKITQNYSKGKLNGAYKKYDGEVLRESGQYVEGLKNGEWKTFNRLGEIKLIENFSAGKLNGPFNKFNNIEGQAKVVYKNPIDQFNCDESMLNMLKHLMFYVDGIANKYLYVDFVKEGIIKIANDGYTQEEKVLINGEIDRWVSFSNISNDKRSSDLNYDFGKSQDWSIRFPGKPLPKISNGLIEKGQYVDDLKNGEWNYFDNEGKLTLFQNYKLDKLDGAFKKYSGDVVIEEGIYANGLMSGEWKFYYSSGKIKGSGKFLNSDGGNIGSTGIPINGREGIWILYHENGKKSQECSYTNGKVNGSFISYYENGNKKFQVKYLNDNLDFEGNLKTNFNEDGSIREKFEYKNGKWVEQLTPEERFARMQKQVEEMNEKADELAERMQKQADNNSRNSSYTKVMCNGVIWDKDIGDDRVAMEIELICPYCSKNVKHGWVNYYFHYQKGRNNESDCDWDEYTCTYCGKVSVMKPCLIKHLNKRDKF